MTKLIVIPIFLFFLAFESIAQRVDKCAIFGAVFFEKSRTYADVIIFVEEDEYMADLQVYKEENKLLADQSGLWYVVEDKSFADFVVYIEKDKRFSDFSVYFTQDRAFAGCY